MSNAPSDESPLNGADELLPEYQFDYAKAKPNRFVDSCPPGGRLIVLEPDIAQVFTSAESVNSVLRALIANMPPVSSR
jgi:hypothetical protein